MKKTYLLTPGPTPIPERVISELGRPLIHHRTPEFKALMQEVRLGLRKLFQTQEDVLLTACSGTGLMEAAIANLFSRGESVLTLNAGKFGARWAKIAEAFGLKVKEIRSPQAGQVPSLVEVEATLQSNPEIKAVLFQASETSTGVRLPTPEIVDICKKNGVLSVCDAITACGVFDLPMDLLGIDCMMTASQKALMLPPGLGMISLSKRAWESQSKSDLPKFYFDLARERKNQENLLTAWTPATQLIQGLRVSLEMIFEEGLAEVFQRHNRLARATRAGIEALGLSVLASKECMSPAVTAIRVPPQIVDGKAIPKIMREKQGVVIAGGQDELEGKIFRLSHFGYVGPWDITTALLALELTLAELGYRKSSSVSFDSTLKILSE